MALSDRMGMGPVPAKIMIVGEAFGEHEEYRGEPFIGPGGAELNKMLHEAGILRTECYLTNLVNARPLNNDISTWVAKTRKDITSQHVALRDKFVLPIVKTGFERLQREIELVNPNLIITLGNYSTWALTGTWGIMKWRGSQLEASGRKVIPTVHPSLVLRQWDYRALAVNDLKRARREASSLVYNRPSWQFTVRPGFEVVMSTLQRLAVQAEQMELWIDFDIETRAGHIACVGLSWSQIEAICIPLMCVERQEGFWTPDEEAFIVYAIYKLLTHPNIRVRWQNGLYDAQYVWRHWHFVPRGGQDTMISQHSLFAALPKGLSFLASMYCDWYVYWKDEGKTWGEGMGEDQLWGYNCQDCIYTRGSGEALQSAVRALGMEKVEAFQQAMFWPVLRAMQLGIRVFKPSRDKMALEIQEAMAGREAFLFNLIGPININSPKQMQALFYEDLGQKPIMNRTIRNGVTVMSPSTDDEALQEISRKEPLLKPVCNAISDLRTLGKFLKDFVMMPLDSDGRMRCSFNIAGDAGGKSAPYSYRLSSSENAFGSGGNLQTIPSEKSKSSGKAAARGSMDFTLPNIRSMYGPDPGFTMFDGDLERADLYVVVWESDDEMLKAAMRMGADIHLLNVYSLDGAEPPPLEELVEGHARYPDHRGPRKHKREFAKVFCHATNYLGKARTVAAHTGRTVAEIERSQKLWFGAHPGILKWHERVIEQVNKYRFVENKFGYRWHIFDRINEQLYPKAVAWIPQSTVGGVINRVWKNVYDNIPEVQVLLQVHDSLVGQGPTHRKHIWLPQIAEQARILVPYEDPLIIPFGVKSSEVSWGDCQ